MTPPWTPCGAQFFPLHVQASLAYPRLDLPAFLQGPGQARHPSRRPSSHGLFLGPCLDPRAQASTVVFAPVAQSRPSSPKLFSSLWPQPAPRQPLSSELSLGLFPSPSWNLLSAVLKSGLSTPAVFPSCTSLSPALAVPFPPLPPDFSRLSLACVSPSQISPSPSHLDPACSVSCSWPRCPLFCS